MSEKENKSWRKHIKISKSYIWSGFAGVITNISQKKKINNENKRMEEEKVTVLYKKKKNWRSVKPVS